MDGAIFEWCDERSYTMALFRAGSIDLNNLGCWFSLHETRWRDVRIFVESSGNTND